MKDKLKEYRTLKLDLEDVEQKLETKVVQDIVQGTSKGPPYIMQNHRIEGVPDNYRSLLIEKSDLKAQIYSIENFVAKIPCRKARKAIRLYYMEPIDEDGNKPTWNMVADKLKDGSTENSIKKTVSRYLNGNL